MDPRDDGCDVDEIVQGRCGVDRVVEVEDQKDEEGERGLAARGRVVEEVVDWPDWEYEPQQHVGQRVLPVLRQR